MFSAARIDHIDVTIEPALTRGDWVVCDRFADSTRAYQGAAGQLDPEFITRLEDIVLDRTRPDLTLILDLPAERGLERAAKRRSGQGAPDRFEGEQVEFHRRVREGFLTIARDEPERVMTIDATQSMAEITARIAGAIIALVTR